jgi:ribonuclease P protein component
MLNFCFPKASRLRFSKQYRLVNKQGEQRGGRLIQIQVRRGYCSDRKLGITVSRRYGKAIVRNRFKRLVREAFRLSQHDLPSHIHVNVRPFLLAKEAQMQDIRQELITLLTTPPCSANMEPRSRRG